jgi:hypothetical protein
MSRSGYARASIGAVIVLIASACGSATGGQPAPSTPPVSPPATPSASEAARRSLDATPTPHASSMSSPGYGSPPPGWPSPAPLVPATPLPDPSGLPLPSLLAGRQYNTDPPEILDTQAQVLTLRGADDPHCMAMFGGRSTCFTILWTPNYPDHANDPAVRGPARIEGGNLVLGFALIPNDPACEGTSATYAIAADGWTLASVDAPPCGFPSRFVRH